MNIGQRIKTLRENNQLTQAALGKAIGVNKATVNRYETGVLDIKRTIAIKLAEALNTTPAYLMGWEDEYGNNKLIKNITVENLSADENELLNNYRKLNTPGKEKANEYVSDLITIEKYIDADNSFKSTLG